MDHPLGWRVGRPQALAEVTGTEVLADAVAGDSYILDVDHSLDASFALAEPPRITAVTGVTLLPCCDGTDGDGYRLKVEVDLSFVGADYGYGGAGPDIVISWARRGVLNGPT